MTMKRTEKASHAEALQGGGDGFTKIRFAHPKLCRAAKIDRGHDRMTTAEYAEHRMGRGRASVEIIQEYRMELRRRQRVLGGRRITGRVAGTKHRK